MSSFVTTPENKTFEGIDVIIGLTCIAVMGASVIVIALSIALWKAHSAIWILSPVGGLAQVFLWSMYCNHRLSNRGVWKLTIKNGFDHLRVCYAESNDMGTGWRGLLEKVIFIFVMTITAITPVAFSSLVVLVAGSVFAAFIRIALLILGK